MTKHLDLKSFSKALKESFHVQHQDRSYERSLDAKERPFTDDAIETTLVAVLLSMDPEPF